MTYFFFSRSQITFIIVDLLHAHIMIALSECSKLRQTECFKEEYIYFNIVSNFLV